MKKQQITTKVNLVGAASAKALHWSDINWPAVKANVFRLQMRIAEAERSNKPGKVNLCNGY